MNRQHNPNSPFLGLVPYSRDDAKYFFGRERITERVIASTQAHSLTLLYGASGVGKTSVIMAGALPMLEQSSDTVTVVFNDWRNRDLLSALKAEIKSSLTRKFGGVTIGWDRSLMDCLEQCTDAIADQEGHILLIFDQFEEYFAVSREGTATDRFATELARAMRSESRKFNFLISIRDDALAKIDQLPIHLRNLFEHRLQVRPLGLAEAQRAIQGPLDTYNLSATQKVSIEPELINTVLTDLKTVEGRAGGDRGEQIDATVLQQVMLRLWATEMQNYSRVLRLSTYQDLGSTKHIFQTTLETQINRLSRDEKSIAACVFRCLIPPSKTKIAMTSEDLAAYGNLTQPGLLSKESIDPVVERLAAPEARILRAISSQTEVDEPRYEIFHEALLGPASDWSVEYQESERATKQRKQFERKRRLYARFATVGVVLAMLMSGLTVFAFRQKAFALAQTAALKLSNQTATSARTEAEANAKLFQQQREIATQKAEDATKARTEADKRRTEAQNAAEEAVIQKDRANNEAIISDANSTASKATELFERDPDLAMWLAINAAGQSRTDKATDTLRDALPLVENVRASFLDASGRVTAAVISDDHHSIVTIGRDLYRGTSTVRVWAWDDNNQGKSGVPRLMFTLDGERDAKSAVFNDKGTLIITTSDDHNARIWNAQTGKLLAVLKGHEQSVNFAAFDPNSNFIVTGSEDWTARVWQWKTPSSDTPIEIKESVELKGHNGPIHFLTVSADGSLIATEAADNTGRLWNFKEIKDHFEEIKANNSPPSPLVLEDLSGPIPAMAFSPDGNKLVTEGKDGDKYVAKVWSTRQGWGKCSTPKGCPAAHLYNLKGHKGAITSVGFSLNRKYIVTASTDGTARIWNVDEPTVVSELRGHEGPISNANFSPDSSRVITAGFDNSARIWDVVSGRAIAQLRGHSSHVSNAVYSGDGEFILTAGGDNRAGLWSASAGQKGDLLSVRDLHGHAAEVMSVSFSPDAESKYVLTGSWDGTARLWKTDTGQSLIEMAVYSQVRSSDFSPDGRWIATGSVDGNVILWAFRADEVQANEEDCSSKRWTSGRGGNHRTESIPKQAGAIMSVAFSRDGKYLLTGGMDKTARVWQEVSGSDKWQEVGAPLVHSEGVYSAAFNRDGDQIVTASENIVRIWRKQPNNQWKKIDDQLRAGERSVFLAAAFSNDGNYIVTSETDGKSKVWMRRGENRWTEAPPFTLTDGNSVYTHADAVYRAVFSPDGQHIVTTSADRTARVWEKVGQNKWRLTRELSRHWGAVYAAAFSDRFIATASFDGLARIYSAVNFQPFSDIWNRANAVHLDPRVYQEGKKYLRKSQTQ